MIEHVSDTSEIRINDLVNFLVDDAPLLHPEKYMQLAKGHLILPLFLYHLKQRGYALSAAMQREMLDISAQHLIREKALLEANAVLLNVGIKPVCLKGSVLAYTVYPEPHLRTMADLDVLVSADQFDAALDSLLTLGYQKISTGVQQYADRVSHHVPLNHRQFPSIMLELHHRLLGHGTQDALPDATLNHWLHQAMPITVKQQILYGMKPEHHLLYLCAHAYLQHGEVGITLRHIYDMHLLISHHDLNWQELITEAKALKWIFLIETALQRVQHLCHTAMPPQVFDDLRANRSPDENIDRIILKNSGDIRGENVLQIFGKLTLNEKISAIRQIAVPSRDYMRQHYRIASDAPVFPYYLYRWYHQIKGLMRTYLRRFKQRQ